MARALPPDLLEVSKPEVELDQGFTTDVVDAGTGIVARAAGFDEAGIAQLAQVFADQRLGLFEAPSEFADGARLVGEFPDDPAPDRAREGVECGQLLERFRGVTAILHVVSGM